MVEEMSEEQLKEALQKMNFMIIKLAEGDIFKAIGICELLKASILDVRVSSG